VNKILGQVDPYVRNHGLDKTDRFRSRKIWTAEKGFCYPDLLTAGLQSYVFLTAIHSVDQSANGMTRTIAYRSKDGRRNPTTATTRLVSSQHCGTKQVSLQVRSVMRASKARSGSVATTGRPSTRGRRTYTSLAARRVSCHACSE
jgi:hypothetical protein